MALVLPPERKRFYQNVSISQGEGEYGRQDGMEGLVPGRGVISPRRLSESMAHPQPGLCESGVCHQPAVPLPHL